MSERNCIDGVVAEVKRLLGGIAAQRDVVAAAAALDDIGADLAARMEAISAEAALVRVACESTTRGARHAR